jgi:hypothetical protein
MLPNFNECWWDSWLLDVAICNSLGGLGGTQCHAVQHLNQCCCTVTCSSVNYSLEAGRVCTSNSLGAMGGSVAAAEPMSTGSS